MRGRGEGVGAWAKSFPSRPPVQERRVLCVLVFCVDNKLQKASDDWYSTSAVLCAGEARTDGMCARGLKRRVQVKKLVDFVIVGIWRGQSFGPRPDFFMIIIFRIAGSDISGSRH